MCSVSIVAPAMLIVQIPRIEHKMGSMHLACVLKRVLAFVYKSSVMQRGREHCSTEGRAYSGKQKLTRVSATVHLKQHVTPHSNPLSITALTICGSMQHIQLCFAYLMKKQKATKARLVSSSSRKLRQKLFYHNGSK